MGTDLFYLIAALIVVGVMIYIVDLIPMDEVFRKIARAILILVVVLALLFLLAKFVTPLLSMGP